MKSFIILIQSVLLAMFIGAVPAVFAETADAPAVEVQQKEAVELQAVSPATATPSAVGDNLSVPEGADHGDVHDSMLSAEKLKDLFWRIVNFLALVVILVKFGAKPIVNGLRGRQERIREELNDLVARRDEAERSYKEFEAKLAGMEKEMERIVERAIAQAEVEKGRILADAEKAAEDIKRQAEAAVQAEIEDAKRVLREEIAEQAAAMAEELIVKNLTPEDQMTITEQYLERVGAVQ
ncbi:MAG: ATP synthase F0 subunit B [Desulfobulbus sp.]|nr:ATP synthase F0 subunit B [Desulfobulbus sp.]